MGTTGSGAGGSSRRETILAAALELFRLRGFHAVGIDEIGTAAGITGPGVYRHFPSKDSLLVALFERISEQMVGLAQKIGTEPLSPWERLERIVDLHVRFAVNEPGLLSVWIQDWRSLPEPDRARIAGRQVAYIAEWVNAAAAVRPELSPGELETFVFAAVAAINSVAFHDSGLDRDSLDRLLGDFALAVLRSPGPGRRSVT